MALKTDVRADTLAKVPMFGDFGRRELGRLATVAEEIDVTAGHDLCVQGERGTWAFVLVDVGAEVVVDGAVVATLEPGELCGELSLLDGGARAATLRTTAAGTVLLIERDPFVELLGSSPHLIGAVLVALGARLRQANALGVEGLRRSG